MIASIVDANIEINVEDSEILYSHATNRNVAHEIYETLKMWAILIFKSG